MAEMSDDDYKLWFNPGMENYTAALHSYPPTAKSPENTNGPVKTDVITNDKEGNRVSGFPTAGDGSSWGEPASPDIGRYPNVFVHQDKGGNRIEMDSTPGGERIQIFHARTGSYFEIDAGGNIVMKGKGDILNIAKNSRIGSVYDTVISAMQGDIRVKASHDTTLESGAGTHIIAGGNLTVSARGDITLKATGQLVIDAQSVKMVSVGGAIDIRSAEEMNLEAKTEFNAQSGTSTSIESKTDTIIAAHGNATVTADKKLFAGGKEGNEIKTPKTTNLESTEANNFKSGKGTSIESSEGMNIKSGQFIHAEATGDLHLNSSATLKAAGSTDVAITSGLKIHLGSETHIQEDCYAKKYWSPGAGGSASPEGGSLPDGAASAAGAADPQENLKTRKKANTERGREIGEAGGGIAANANANQVDPVREPRTSDVPPAESTKQMQPRPHFRDNIKTSSDGASSSATPVQSDLSPSETDSSWHGHTTAATAAAKGVHVLNSDGRASTTNGVFHPTVKSASNIASAGKITGGGTQTAASNVAQKAVDTGKSEITNQTKLSEADTDRIIRTIIGEARGEGLEGQAAVANVILNRYAAAQDGKIKYFGTTINEITKPSQFSAWRTNDPNYSVMSNASKDSQYYKNAKTALNMAVAKDYSNGSLYYKATYAGNTGSHINKVKGIGVHNFYSGKEGGYTAGTRYAPGGQADSDGVYNETGSSVPLPEPNQSFRSTQEQSYETSSSSGSSGSSGSNEISTGEAVKSNIRTNNVAQTMRKVGHPPSVAEASMLALPKLTPKAATSWGKAMSRGEGWRTIEYLLKNTKGDERAGWEEIAKSPYLKKVFNVKHSPIEHIKLWLHSYFRPFMGLGESKWRMLQSANFDSATVTSLLPTSVESLIDNALGGLSVSTSQGIDASNIVSLMLNLQGANTTGIANTSFLTTGLIQ